MQFSKFIESISFPVHLMKYSAVALIAAFWQTAEKIHFLKNPDVSLNCNINPVVDCGTILNHNLSSVFGVPNSMIGMLMFGALLTLGVALFLGVKPTKKVKGFILALATIAILFSAWFFWVSLYIIGKICIFCIFIWGASVPMFVLSLKEYGGAFSSTKRIAKAVSDRPSRYVFLTYLLMIVLFLVRFRDYYFN